ncbi:hypothetical protein E2C01_048609 [Portunus trituberculatus]|uniref:Uncharacterized protein n=1 Tax=Portunus trituberculatus TaxID=210409 RepID=A0A5B7GBI1_PORTR|nr:hypothetical protein [Portunus trituberculatus]
MLKNLPSLPSREYVPSSRYLDSFKIHHLSALNKRPSPPSPPPPACPAPSPRLPQQHERLVPLSLSALP